MGHLCLNQNETGLDARKVLKEVQQRGWSRVRVLESGHNGGYGAGNNFGARQGLPDGSSPDYIYILNPDAFPQAGAIRVLVEYLQAHPQVGFAGSRLHGEDGVFHQSAFCFPSIFSEFESAAATTSAQDFVPLSRPSGCAAGVRFGYTVCACAACCKHRKTRI